MAFKWNIDNTDSLTTEALIKGYETKSDEKSVLEKETDCSTYFAVYNPLCPSPKSEERAKIMAKEMDRFIYLDNNATHPVLPEVRKKMDQITELIGNGSSDHFAGVKVRAYIEESRENIAEFVGIEDASKLIFGGCGSEMNNTLIKGVAFKNMGSEKNQIITTNMEHKSVLETIKYLKKFGFEPIILGADENGLISEELLLQYLSEKTLLVSIMAANNETGTILPIHRYYDIVKSKYPDVIFHSDMSQTIGKIDNVTVRNLDAATFTGHKFGGPIGVGALYLKDLDMIDSLIHGGNQEFKKRAGTYNQIQIFGMSKAISQIHKNQPEKLLQNRNYLEEQLLNNFQCKINCQNVERLANTVSVTFDNNTYSDFTAESLVRFLSDRGIFVSTSSACNSREKKPSYVLKAIGLSDEEAYSTLRISLSKFNTKKDIDILIQELNNYFNKNVISYGI